MTVVQEAELSSKMLDLAEHDLIDERSTAPAHDELQVLFREARRRRRRRRFVGLLVLAVTVTTIAAVVLVRASSISRSQAHETAGPSQQAAPTTPGQVVAWKHFHLDVLSSLNGHVIRTLATEVSEFRGLPSLSVAPGGTVYFDNHAFVGSSPVDRIYSVPVSGGAPSYIADGRTPAVSPDGRFLAYVTNDPVASPVVKEAITIEDLRSHTIRSWTDTAPQADLWALAWSPDSRLLSFSETTWPPSGANASGAAAISYLMFDTARPALSPGAVQRIPLAPGVSWACFIAGSRSGDLVGIGKVSNSSGLRLVEADVRSGRTIRVIGTIPGAVDATIQSDTSGRHLLVAASGSGSFGFGRLYRWTSGSARPTAIAPGVLVAAWVPTGIR